MTALPIATGVTYEEYLRQEQASPTKLEYLRGEIFDMSGGTPEHSAVAAMMTGILLGALEGRPCRVFTSDAKVRIDETDLSTYPDVSVVCGSLVTSPRDRNAITNPILIVEVLSPSTEGYDRSAKSNHYQRLPSLQELVLVDPLARTVEVRRRNERGRFEIYFHEGDASAELASVGATFPIAKLFVDPLAS